MNNLLITPKHCYRIDKLQSEFGEVKCPLLILHGEKDTVCTLAGSKRLHEQAQSRDKTLKVNITSTRMRPTR